MFLLKNLDESTRKEMLSEFKMDVSNGKLYFSKRFSVSGKAKCTNLMEQAITSGSIETLSKELSEPGIFVGIEAISKGVKGVGTKKVPVDAHKTFAEGEFNRYYMRGLCLRAIRENMSVRVYRAKQVSDPRASSELLLGKILNPKEFLEDLQTNIGFGTKSGFPKPNSGLSVELV